MPRLYRGYDGVPDIRRTSADQHYQFWFDPPERVEGIRGASIRAAREFGERWAQDFEIVVMYSGGLDSEWICESLYLAQVPFRPLVVNYKGQNEHDLYWARRYLERRNLLDRTIFWDFDLRGWYGSAEQFEIAEAAQIAELAYTGQFKALLEHANGHRMFLNGYDEPVITANDAGPDRVWNLEYNERHYAIHKLMSVYGVPTQVGGLVDSNMFASYVMCPMWQWLVANLQNSMIWNSELMKVQIYQYAFPFLEARPKYTGFENMLDVVVPATEAWKKRCREHHGTDWLETWSRPIRDVWAEIKESGALDAKIPD